MTTLWKKLRPHVFSWHMLPCLAMLAAASALVIATGQPARLLPAVACVAMMAVMMSAMGGHGHTS